jgi:hypothetical protein
MKASSKLGRQKNKMVQRVIESINFSLFLSKCQKKYLWKKKLIIVAHKKLRFVTLFEFNLKLNLHFHIMQLLW